MPQVLPNTSPAAARDSLTELRRSDEKGRYLVASRAIPADALLWHELPVLVCTSAPVGASDAAGSQSALTVAASEIPEERTFAAVCSALPDRVTASDVLLVLHAVRRLRLFGTRSRCWTMIQQLQCQGDGLVDAGDDVNISPLSPFAQRFKSHIAFSQRLFDVWQREVAAEAAPGSSKALPSSAVVIHASLIRKLFGALQLNSHRCAADAQAGGDARTLCPSSTNVAAPSGSVAVALSSPISTQCRPAVSSSSHGKALSLRLSMLEHSCASNLRFCSEWVDDTALPSDLTGAPASSSQVDQEDEQLVTLGRTGAVQLCASSARRCGRTLVVSMHSLRPIAAGESLAISYYPARVRTGLRQAHLRNLYGFTCRCTMCEGRDVTRAFHCCFPRIDQGESVVAATAAAACSPSSSIVLPSSCPGILAPLRLGTSASDFQCDTCARSLDDVRRQEVLAWETKLRAAGAAEALAAAIANAAAQDLQSQWWLLPHPTHYLYPRR
jgi:hypothetical protein